METWQACPVCNGSKLKQFVGIGISLTSPCDVCDESGLISVLTGHPPKRRVERDIFVEYAEKVGLVEQHIPKNSWRYREGTDKRTYMLTKKGFRTLYIQ